MNLEQLLRKVSLHLADADSDLSSLLLFLCLFFVGLNSCTSTPEDDFMDGDLPTGLYSEPWRRSILSQSTVCLQKQANDTPHPLGTFI